jgi:hypothetical protein
VRTDFTPSKHSGQVLPCNHRLVAQYPTGTPSRAQAKWISYSISKIPMFTFDVGEHHL